MSRYAAEHPDDYEERIEATIERADGARFAPPEPLIATACGYIDCPHVAEPIVDTEHGPEHPTCAKLQRLALIDARPIPQGWSIYNGWVVEDAGLEHFGGGIFAPAEPEPVFRLDALPGYDALVDSVQRVDPRIAPIRAYAEERVRYRNREVSAIRIGSDLLALLDPGVPSGPAVRAILDERP